MEDSIPVNFSETRFKEKVKKLRRFCKKKRYCAKSKLSMRPILNLN